MAPKKPMQRRIGTGAAKSVASLPAGDDAPADVAAQLSYFAREDPDDVRLTLKGLVLDGDGKVDIPAYEDLMPHFSGEPAPDQHPDPERPGVLRGERVPKGMRVWDDARAGADRNGAGWIAVHYGSKDSGDKKKEKWFSIRICGSWRLAFLLARLQRLHWDERAAWLRAPSAPAKSSAAEPAAASTPSKAKSSAAEPAAASTPSKAKASAAEPASAGTPAKAPCDASLGGDKPPPPAGASPATARKADPLTPKTKRPRAEAGEECPQKSARKAGHADTPSGEGARKVSAIGAATMAGSVRLQQILAARQLQQQQQQ